MTHKGDTYMPLPLTSETSMATVKRKTKPAPPPQQQSLEIIDDGNDDDDDGAYQALPAHAGSPACKMFLKKLFQKLETNVCLN